MSSIDLQLDQDQLEAWRRVAGEKPLGEWLAGLADAAVLEHELGKETVGESEVWPRVIKLAYPIEDAHGERITQLKVRRGVAGDIKGLRLPTKAEDISADLLMKVGARLTDLSNSYLFERLDGEDAGEVTKIALGFLARFLGGRSNSRPR